RIRLLLPGRPLDRLVLLLRLRLLCLVLFAKTPHGQVLSFVRSVAPRGRGLYSGTAGILSSLARSAALPTPREVVYASSALHRPRPAGLAADGRQRRRTAADPGIHAQEWHESGRPPGPSRSRGGVHGLVSDRLQLRGTGPDRHFPRAGTHDVQGYDSLPRRRVLPHHR